MSELVLWIVCGVLAVVVVGLALLYRRGKKRWAAVLDQQEETHGGHVRTMAETFERRETQLAIERSEALDAFERVRQYAAMGVRFEGASRAVIVDACEKAGIDGVLATNVVFVPADASATNPFVAQIDHVLLTEDFTLIVESKHWRGLVFDGRRPSSVHPSFGLLLPGTELEAPFAVQVVPAGNGTLTVRVHGNDEAPCTQVRQQALRLSKYLASALGVSAFIRTCVLYSHSTVQLYANRRDVGGSSVTTDVVTAGEFASVLTQAKAVGKRGPGVEGVKAVAGLLASLGADMHGLGVYSTSWRSDLFPDGTGLTA